MRRPAIIAQRAQQGINRRLPGETFIIIAQSGIQYWKKRGVVVVNAAFDPIPVSRQFEFNGAAWIPHVAIVSNAGDAEHELRHLRQWEALGPAFPVAYAVTLGRPFEDYGVDPESFWNPPASIARTCPAFRVVFAKAYEFTRQHEGGFQNDPEDRGNWTGCRIGDGDLIGTDRGISACYLALRRSRGDDLPADPRELTDADVRSVYRDIWNESIAPAYAPTDPALAIAAFDLQLHSGPSNANDVINEAKRDGSINAQDLNAHRLYYLTSLSTLWGTYGRGWTRRVAGLIEMIAELEPVANDRAGLITDRRGVWTRIASVFGDPQPGTWATATHPVGGPMLVIRPR